MFCHRPCKAPWNKLYRFLLLQLGFVLCLAANSQLRAQSTDSRRVLLQDGWIEDMSARIALDLSFNNSYKAFEVRTTGTDILLYPNTPNNLRLNLSYEFISFGIQFSPDFLPGNGDEKLRGRTDSWQIGTAIILRHWFIEVQGRHRR